MSASRKTGAEKHCSARRLAKGLLTRSPFSLRAASRLARSNASPSRNPRRARQVERESDGARWRGDFSRKYVEEVSAKTGSFKKFAVFAKMLVAAVVNESSESVSVDPVSYTHLTLPTKA